MKYSATYMFIFITALVHRSILADEHNLQWHGFIAQGLIDVNGSDFVNNNEKVSVELTELGINTSYQLSSKFRVAGQAVYIDGGNRYNKGARIDYLLLDWSAYSSQDWLLNVYLGRFKNSHWLYSSTRDVPFTRPSIILPQSIYFDGFRDIAVGGDGISIKSSHNSDLYGDFDLTLSYGTSDISKQQTEIILSKHTTGNMDHDFDIQGSLYWQPQLSRWRFGIALLDSDFSYRRGNNDVFQSADISLQRYFINLMYEGEYWEFSSEILQERLVMGDFYFKGFHRDTIAQGYFIQSRYQASRDINLLLRYDHFYSNKEDKNGRLLESSTGGQVPRYFGYMKDYTLGFSYDMSANFRLQLEFHQVKGAARLTPVVLPNTELNNQEKWQFWALQLMYWF